MRRALHFCARGAGDRGPWMPVLCGFWPGSLVVERVNSLHSSALPVQCSGNGPGTDCYCAVLRPLTGIPEDGRLLDPTIVETETETETATQTRRGPPIGRQRTMRRKRIQHIGTGEVQYIHADDHA